MGLASLDNFGRLWGRGTVSGCLVSDPRVIRAGEGGPEWESLGEEEVGAWALDWWVCL